MGCQAVVNARNCPLGVTNKQTMLRYAHGDRFPPPDVLLHIREVTKGQVSAESFVDQHTGANRPSPPQSVAA